MAWVLWLFLGAVGYVVLGLVFTVVAWRNARTPPRKTPADRGLAFREVWFPTAGGKKLHGWFTPPPGEKPHPKRPVVILVHGWGRNAERMLPYIRALAPAGFPTLAFDARHHGLSDRDGYASMKKFAEDIRAAADFLENQGHRPPFPVIGLSIGGSAAIYAAACDPRLGPVVTVGAFAHPRDAMIALGFGRFVFAPIAPLLFRFIEWRVGTPLDELAPEANISKIHQPVLLVHGARDTVVPVAHAQRLCSGSGGRAELWLLPDRGHSDVHLEPQFFPKVLAFLEEGQRGR
ncbi:MAG: alpha/beta hydrolase [Thermoanaerobaculum sp.]